MASDQYDLSFNMTHCCGFQEISGLRAYKDDPKGAIASFCKVNLGQRVRFGMSTGSANTLYPMYLFSAAVHDDVVGGILPNYGSQLAGYIEDHGLGLVTPSPVVRNAAFHSGHSNQLWIWTPDRDALVKWFDAYKAETEPKVEAPKVDATTAELKPRVADDLQEAYYGGMPYGPDLLQANQPYYLRPGFSAQVRKAYWNKVEARMLGVPLPKVPEEPLEVDFVPEYEEGRDFGDED